MCFRFNPELLQGLVVFSETKENVRSNQPLAIDAGIMAEGIYILELQNGSHRHAAKMVIRR